jgi:oxaloacetate decarboxylase alpha subunit
MAGGYCFANHKELTMREIDIVDTTYRDANASQWGEKMTTAMMYKIAPMMDRAGFKALDATAISHFEYAVRYLRENPWERMRFLSKVITSAPLSMMMLGSSLNIFRYTGGPIIGTWMERLVANGIKRVQLMESSNNMEDMAEMARYAKDFGITVVVALVYSHSEVHTDEYYAKITKDAVSLRPDAIYLKDPGGLITPERTRTLIPAIQKNLKGLPLEFHSHCTTGLAPLCYLEALKLGVKTFHTSCSPLANGPSQPSTETFLKNAGHMGYSSKVNLDILDAIATHFLEIAKAEELPIGRPVEYDLYQYEHQVPGGVISNLKRQLAQLGAEERLGEILKETVKVRKDLGYPIMVTPFSQFVVTQASVNVMQGERYKTITDEIIKFALGHYGKQIKPVDENLMDRIQGLSRTKDFADFERSETSIDDFRKEMGSGFTEEELLLLVLVPDDDLNAMRAAGPIRTEYSGTGKPLLAFVKELMKQKKPRYIHVQKEDFSITLKKTK